MAAIERGIGAIGAIGAIAIGIATTNSTDTRTRAALSIGMPIAPTEPIERELALSSH